jgi:microcystin-dependent protein
MCDGRAVSRSTYSALYGVIGTTYGAGDGSTTFNVPDARGRVLAAADNMGTGSAGRLFNWSLGVAGGESTHALSGAENGTHNHGDYGHSHADAGHNHGVSGNSATAGGSGAALGVGWSFGPISATGVGNANIQTSYANISYSGSGSPHNNVQPTMTAYVFIYAGV